MHLVLPLSINWFLGGFDMGQLIRPGDFTEEVFQLASADSDSPFSLEDLQFAVECTFIALMNLEALT